MVKVIKQCVSWLGLDKEAFSGHSLRRGGATSYALAGVSDATIRTMGRWRSFCYQQYIEAPDSAISRAMQSMATAEVKVFGGRSLEDIISISLDNLAIPLLSSRAVECALASAPPTSQHLSASPQSPTLEAFVGHS